MKTERKIRLLLKELFCELKDLLYLYIRIQKQIRTNIRFYI